MNFVIFSIGQFLSPLLTEQEKGNTWIGTRIEYKGYVGVFEFDEKENLFQGQVTNINDLVIFQGKSVENIKLAFKDAVNDYLNWCKKYGRDPETPFLSSKSR